MASATHDTNVENQGPLRYFNETEWQRLRDDDSQAWRTVSLELTAVVTLGLLAMIGTVLWVL